MARLQSLSLSPSSSPCRSVGNHSQRLFQKTIECFDCKINGQALWAVLLHSFGEMDRQNQPQGISVSGTVAASSNRLA